MSEEYILSNKEAWEEAFEFRAKEWGADIINRVKNERFPFLYDETISILEKYNWAGKCIGQFCCNNGRELLSIVHTVKAGCGIGFDIAENMVAFANDTAKELEVPCEFVAGNILEMDDTYAERFDLIIITEGALCWFRNLTQFFAVISKCMKQNGVLVITESHSFINILAGEGEEPYDPNHPKECVYNYFHHEWTNTEGMSYITGRDYPSKTFTDYTHSMSEIINAMVNNKLLIFGLQELEYDVVGGFEHLNHQGLPLAMVMEGKKIII